MKDPIRKIEQAIGDMENERFNNQREIERLTAKNEVLVAWSSELRDIRTLMKPPPPSPSAEGQQT